MKKVRGTLAVLAIAVGAIGIQACSEIPTAAGSDDEPVCYWIDGTLHCDEHGQG